MSEWKNDKIDNVVLINPETLSSKSKLTYINYLDTGNITKGKIDNLQKFNLEIETPPSRAKRIVKLNDIIYSTVRPAHEHYGFINNSIDNLIVSTGFAVLRPKQDLINGKFLYYYLTLSEITDYLSNVAEDSTSAYPSIKPEIIADLVLSYPSLPEQEQIAEILSSLDDKIDLLHRQNKTLESLAETYFRQWFIEEAIEDNIMVSKLAVIDNEIISPSKKPNDIFYHYSIPAFDNNRTPVKELGQEILSSKFIVKPRTILVSKLNPANPRIWNIDRNIIFNSICSTEFQVIKPLEDKYYLFLYFLFGSYDVSVTFSQSASGTSGSHQRIKPEYILQISTPRPDEDKLNIFNKVFEPMVEKISLNSKQIKTLASLRDTLLPKLISGEIRIKMEV